MAKKIIASKSLEKNVKLLIPQKERIEETAWLYCQLINTFNKNYPKMDIHRCAEEIFQKEPIKKIKMQAVDFYEKGWFNNLYSIGVRPYEQGWLTITRWEKRGDQIRLIEQKVAGINSAIRMQDHILNLYKIGDGKKKSELEQIYTVEQTIQKANNLLLNWKSSLQPDRQKIKKDLTNLILSLENCRHPVKIEVRQKAVKIKTFRDRLGRINPGSLAAETIDSLNQLTKRLYELQIITAIIALRKEILIFEKRRLKQRLTNAIKQIAPILKHSIFRGKAISAHEKVILQNEIGKTLYHLNNVWASPYREQAEQTRLFLSNALRLMKIGDQYDIVKNLLVEGIKILETDMKKLG